MLHASIVVALSLRQSFGGFLVVPEHYKQFLFI